MKVEIELTNRYNTFKDEMIKSRSTRELSISDAHLFYDLLEQIFIRFEQEGRIYWKDKIETPKEVVENIIDETMNE
jgi:hypothetical protein